MKLFVICVLFGASLLAQNATISGKVEDSTNAAVPKATVTATNEQQGTKRLTLTNEAGVYLLPALPPGSYRITVEAPGFQTATRERMRLEVAENAQLDIRLEIGKVEQKVTVEGRAEGVNAVDASVSTVIDHGFVANLPMNGRSFHSLIELAPGVVPVPGGSDFSPGVYSVNGQRSNANSYAVDGVSVNLKIGASQSLGVTGTGTNLGTSALGGSNNLVSIDALQEFRVLTSTYAPEYGRSPGGQVAVVTRSGTNQYHGSLFEYFRNEKLDSNDWFLNRSGINRPPLRQNNFGGVFGGPIVKDRTFFFFSYEGLRLRQPVAGVTDVPSLSLRQTAPAAVRPLLNAFPLPTGPEGTNGLAPSFAGITNPSTLDSTSIRVDHMVSSKLQLFGRYNSGPSSGTTRGGSMALSSLNIYNSNLDTLTVGVVAILSPTITNDLRANFSRAEGNRHAIMDDFGGAVPVPDSIALRPGYTLEDSNFLFRINGGIATTVAEGVTAHTKSRQYNFVDSLSAIRGAHQMKFGFDYRRLRSNFQLPRFLVSTLTNDAAAVRAGTTGGIVGMYGPAQLLLNSWSFFAQDTWKLGKRLSLTYGFRWELNAPPNPGDGQQFLGVTNLSNPASLGAAPQGTPIYRARYNNFAPRAGIAYQLIEKPRWGTVIRTGFGLFYDNAYGRAASLAGNGAPGVSSLFTLPATTPLPVPANIVPPPFARTPPFSNFIGLDPDLVLPRTWQWNFAVEQTLGGAQSLIVSYVGAAGRKLLVGETFANLNASFLSKTTLGTNNSVSDYHSLQVEFQRRLSRGFQVLTAYTWSHAIDTNSSDQGGSTDIPHPVNFYANQNRGNSDFDIRHSFTTALLYQIPTPRFAGRVGESILGGWEFDPIVRARTAAPVDVTASRNITGVAGMTSRADLVPGQPLYIYDPLLAGGRRFNPAAFALPAVAAGFVQGTFPRNVMRGFDFAQLDIALNRTFKMSERMSLQFRGELFNITNHPNFAPPPGRCCGATFGISNSMLGRSLGNFNPLYQIGGPRSTQLALRLRF